MVATVRIAPVEQWCEFYVKRISERPIVKPGDAVQIIPESCAVDPPALDLKGHLPGFRWWRVTDEFVAASGRPSHCCYICEHMLEMD